MRKFSSSVARLVLVAALIGVVLGGAGCATRGAHAFVRTTDPVTGIVEEVEYDEKSRVTVGSKQALSEGEFLYQWQADGGGNLGAGSRGVDAEAGDGQELIRGLVELARIAGPFLQALAQQPDPVTPPALPPPVTPSIADMVRDAANPATAPPKPSESVTAIQAILGQSSNPEALLWFLLEQVEAKQGNKTP